MVARKISSVVAIAMMAAIVTTFYVQARPNGDRLNGGRVSTQASTRLMKELKDFYKSDSYKKGLLTVELVDDNIYEWHVKYFANDPKLPLFKGLQELKKNGGEDHILLHVMYNDNYPNEPPFVRVVYPHLIQGMLYGGGICHQVLTKSGWNRGYTIETLILQLAAEKLNDTKVFSGDTGESSYEWIFPEYTLQEAKKEFDKVVKKHESNGDWPTTPKPLE